MLSVFLSCVCVFRSFSTRSVVSLLPFESMQLGPDSQVLLNIPMDDETPSQVSVRSRCACSHFYCHFFRLFVTFCRFFRLVVEIS